jgi:hypothetical protein
MKHGLANQHFPADAGFLQPAAPGQAGCAGRAARKAHSKSQENSRGNEFYSFPSLSAWLFHARELEGRSSGFRRKHVGQPHILQIKAFRKTIKSHPLIAFLGRGLGGNPSLGFKEGVPPKNHGSSFR